MSWLPVNARCLPSGLPRDVPREERQGPFGHVAAVTVGYQQESLVT